MKDKGEYTLNYGLGVDLSLERNPRRYWLIPTFGLEIGGSWSPRLSSTCQTTGCEDKAGHDFVISPRFGVIIYNRSPLWVTLAVSYHMPMKEWNQFRGYKTLLGLHYGMW